MKIQKNNFPTGLLGILAFIGTFESRPAQADLMVLMPYLNSTVNRDMQFGPFKCNNHDLHVDPSGGHKKRCTLTYTYDTLAGSSPVPENSSIFTHLKINVHYFDPATPSKYADVPIDVPLGPNCTTGSLGVSTGSWAKKVCQTNSFTAKSANNISVDEDGTFQLNWSANISMIDADVNCPQSFNGANFDRAYDSGPVHCFYQKVASCDQKEITLTHFSKTDFTCLRSIGSGSTASQMIADLNKVDPKFSAKDTSVRFDSDTAQLLGSIDDLGTWPTGNVGNAYFTVYQTGNTGIHFDTPKVPISGTGAVTAAFALKNITCGQPHQYYLNLQTGANNYSTQVSKNINFPCPIRANSGAQNANSGSASAVGAGGTGSGLKKPGGSGITSH